MPEQDVCLGSRFAVSGLVTQLKGAVLKGWWGRRGFGRVGADPIDEKAARQECVQSGGLRSSPVPSVLSFPAGP